MRPGEGEGARHEAHHQLCQGLVQVPSPRAGVSCSRRAPDPRARAEAGLGPSSLLGPQGTPARGTHVLTARRGEGLGPRTPLTEPQLSI